MSKKSKCPMCRKEKKIDDFNGHQKILWEYCPDCRKLISKFEYCDTSRGVHLSKFNPYVLDEYR